MNENLKKLVKDLEHKITVLEEENAQLAERAEDSLLLGLVSENVQNIEHGVKVFENTLERISILKSIPFAICGELEGTKLRSIASYASFSDQPEIGCPITLKPDILAELSLGPLVIDQHVGLEHHFAEGSFSPKTVALIPFRTQALATGIFIFIDDSVVPDRLASMIVLLGQVVDMAVAKYDNLYLLDALADANKDLEMRIDARTKDLANAIESLQLEIVERKISEKALSESHQTFLTVLNGIDATIYVADLETYRIEFMNKFMIDTFGKDLTGEICHEVFRGEEQPCEICTNKQLLDEQGKPKGVTVWQGRNPVTGNFYINYDRAIKWIDGRMVRLQIATDITETKKMESQLQQAQRYEAIGTLAGGIAHDFNNLLMGIQGRASLITADMELSYSHKEHLDAIEEYIRSATDLTRQLLGFARGGKYEVKPTDLNRLISKSVNMFARTKKEIRIHEKLDAVQLVVAVDRKQIEQVLLNLFINAWQAMPDGGDLYLETKRIELDENFCQPHKATPGPYAKISVADTGIGMTPEIRRQIFDPFFTTKAKKRGAGLGLASAYGIVKNHNGIISVSSESGQGSRFEVYLPLSDQKVHREQTPKAGLIKGSETILLVDDETMILEVGSAMLRKLGYRVFVVRSGEEAIERLKESSEDIDLVILDLVMPGMDGGKTFDHIRKISPDLPVLISSGYAIDGKASEIIRRGCNGFIQKPFNLSELSEQVSGVISSERFLEKNN